MRSVALFLLGLCILTAVRAATDRDLPSAEVPSIPVRPPLVAISGQSRPEPANPTHDEEVDEPDVGEEDESESDLLDALAGPNRPWKVLLRDPSVPTAPFTSPSEAFGWRSPLLRC